MLRIAGTLDGFIDLHSYVADDGERMWVVRFASRESHRAWARHPDHRAAQQRGRDGLYSWYDISVAEETYGRVYDSRARPSESPPPGP